MSMSAREAAGVLAQCKWLRDNIHRWEEAAKNVLAEELAPGERTAAIAPDGTNLGMVTRTTGARSMTINNEAGFIAWVAQRYPTEVERVVRPAFVKLCTEKVKAIGALPDANGEICPHVGLDVSEPWNMVKLSDTADMEMVRMISYQRLMDVVTPKSLLIAPELPETQDIPLEQYEGRPWVDTAEEAAGGSGLNEIYDGPMEDTTQGFIEEGPPNWLESNTFETSDEIRKRR